MPGMRSATARASARLELGEFQKDSDVAPTLVDRCESGFLRDQYTRPRLHRFTGRIDMLTPKVATPLLATCLSLIGIRGEASALTHDR